MKINSRFLVMITLAFFLQNIAAAGVQDVSFKTRDAQTLQARYSPPVGEKPVVVMLHGLAAQKEEWHLLEDRLRQDGFGTFAYDARGHGKSSLSKDANGSPNGYQYFGTPGPGSQWMLMIDDVGAAFQWVRTKTRPDVPLILFGASLGANVSLNYAALTRRPKAVGLFSPGLVYAGVQTEGAITETGAIPILIVASKADVYAYKSSLLLKSKNKNVVFIDEVKPGHGVQMFDDALLKKILLWLNRLK